MENFLRLEKVSFTAQNIRIIHDVSFTIDEGKTTALVGSSGCGKSTLLKLCAGLLLPTSGEVLYHGKDIVSMNRSQTKDFRRESGFVFQNSALWANQNLQDTLELPLQIHFPEMTKTQRLQRISEVTKEVGYKRSLSVRPDRLSMGEQKLIAFARAMILRPKLLFLDEWTESLDDASARRLIGLVKRRQLDNNTIVFVSHNLGIIRNLADFVVMVVGGYIYLKLTREQLAEDNELMDMIEKGLT